MNISSRSVELTAATASSGVDVADDRPQPSVPHPPDAASVRREANDAYAQAIKIRKPTLNAMSTFSSKFWVARFVTAACILADGRP
jgi:hypothetical protein